MNGRWEVDALRSDDSRRNTKFIAEEGIYVEFVETQQSHASRPDPDHPKADAIISEAFRLARVRVNGGGGGANAEATENRLTITVGSRRVDDGELVH
jgi:hypothetical protein